MNFQFRFSHIWPWWDGNEDKDCFLVVQTGPWIQRTIAARIIDGKLGECTVSSSGQDAQPAVRSHQLASSWHLHLTAFSTWRKTCRQPAKHPSLQFLLGFTLTCSIAKNHSTFKTFCMTDPSFWWGGSHLQLSKNKNPIFLCVPAYATQVWCCQAAVCLDNAQRLWGEKGMRRIVSRIWVWEKRSTLASIKKSEGASRTPEPSGTGFDETSRNYI